MFFRKKKPEPVKQEPKLRQRMAPIALDASFEQPKGAYTVDSAMSIKSRRGFVGVGIDEQMAAYFLQRTSPGYAMCAHIAKHWLVDKAIGLPARDAMRKGWKIQTQDTEIIRRLGDLDDKMDIALRLRDFIRMGRTFGGQLALFDIATENPNEYYEQPFNLDGVQRGAYKGIILIDPVDVSPILTADATQDPASPMYMKPTYWLIGGRRYHHTHVMQFTPYPVPKMARHSRNYFGVSVPERIYERVYGAERIADEAPALVMTKRLMTVGVEGLADANERIIESNLAWLSDVRDNFGVMLNDGQTTVQQLETSLTDLDAVTMTHYQLVAAAAGVPATKLLGTSPKGFNATGEYDEESYRQDLESLQEADLLPLLKRHYEIGCRHLGITDVPDVQFNPLDSPTAKEQEEIDLAKAQRDQILSAAGAIDGYDIRERVSKDEDSPYFGVSLDDDVEPIAEPQGGLFL